MKAIFNSLFRVERLIGYALVATFLFVYLWNPGPLELARLKVFDFYQQAKPRPIPQPAAKPVTIIDIDEQSLESIGQWPWPRTVLAKLTSNVMQMGGIVFAYDMVFAEPDRLNPASFAANVNGLDDATKDKLNKLVSNDDVFANVIKRSRVVMGQAGRTSETEGTKGPPASRSVGVRRLKNGAALNQVVLSFPSIVRNIPVLEAAAKHKGAGFGMFNAIPDQDGIIRNVPLFFAHQKKIFPALTVEMLRIATGRKTVAVFTDAAGVKEVRIAKGLTIKTDKEGRVWPYFSRSDKDKYVSARDVINGTVDPAMIKNKMILLGTSAVGLRDIRSIPTERDIPGVEVHAQLLEAVLQKTYLERPNYAAGAELAFILFGGLIMIVLVPWVGAKWTGLLFVVTASTAGGLSWYLFTDQLVLLDASYSIVSTLLIYTTMTYVGYAKEEAERKQTRDAFSKYLSPDMVKKVAGNPGELKLGGDQRDMTLLFCDVRGFTTISEQFDAIGLTSLINKLLTPLTNVILARQGTVDKYMGDCIMAFWNAPLDDENHAYNGCVSALAMLAEMQPLNDRLEIEAAEEGRKHIPLKVGLGLNSGPAVVGNMGSDQRFDYSVLGDTVNLAARLEGQSKSYGVNIVIGEKTEVQVKGLATLELDLIKVKGKTEAVRIYCLQGDEAMAQSEDFRNLEKHHIQMLESYAGQNWEYCLKEIQECRYLCEPFGLDGLYDLYETRVADFKANPPGDDWDGVFVATTK